MQCGRRRIDVLVVFAARLLEPVQGVLCVVPGQAGVRLALLRQLHRLMLAGHYTDRLVPDAELVQMGHGCGKVGIEGKKKGLIQN